MEAPPPIVPIPPADIEPLEAMMIAELPPAPSQERFSGAAPAGRPSPPDIEAAITQIVRQVGADRITRGYARALLDACNGDLVSALEWVAEDDSPKKPKSAPKKKPPKPPPPPQFGEPEVDVSALARYDFQQGGQYVKTFTNAEKATLLRLLVTHPVTPAWDVLQVFIFSDKSFETASENLRLM
jgi:hypothetical protein